MADFLKTRGGWRFALLIGMGVAVAQMVTALQVHADSFRALRIDGTYVKWQARQASKPITLTYAIVDETVTIADAINCGHMRPVSTLLRRSQLERVAFDRALDAAFATWQNAANISFKRALKPAKADILIGEQVQPKGIAYTNLSLPPIEDMAPRQTTRAINQAQICLNPKARWKDGFNGNLTTYDIGHVLTHEIGHALGLDHPGPEGDVMSFKYLENIDGLSEGDRRGVIALYGKRTSQAGK